MLDSGAAPPEKAANAALVVGLAPAPSPQSVLATLVPNSSIQFLDFEIAEEVVAHTRRRFLEEGGEAGEPTLHVAAIGDGVFYHPVTNTPCDPASTSTIGGIDALAPLLGVWLPLPFMRVSRTEDADQPALDEGPSNWVRVHITKDTAAPAGTRYRVVVAIDTAVDAAPAIAGRADIAPTLQDLRSSCGFRFSDDVNDIAWFVSEAWVDDWLRAAYTAGRARGSQTATVRPSTVDSGRSLEHLAHYLTLLAVLKDSCDIPALRFLEPNAFGAYADAVCVDLALDLGSSSTCVLLAEQLASGSGRAQRSLVRTLCLRNLTVPSRIDNDPVSSRLIFSRAMFGDEALSRWSGRTQAFHWPSPVRIGTEAEELAAESAGPETITGVSSPAHYIWDEQPSRHVWRFAGDTTQAARLSPIVSGTFLTRLTEAGDYIETRTGQGAATKPRFSRSSLTQFLIGEVLLHAISSINAPATRESAGKPNTARRLDRILLTPPPGMGEAEIAILRRRAEAAVKLVWNEMGWSADGHLHAPPAPTVTVVADTATCTQLAYLDNEITHKFRGRSDTFLSLVGKPRAGFAGARTVRIATLDVGGASTGLSVVTYEPSSSGALAGTHQLVDGFEIGCDSVIKALTERVILPAIAQRLAECKHGDPHRLLSALLATPERHRPAWTGDLGRRLGSQVLAPAARALMTLYAQSEADAADAPCEPRLGALVSSQGGNEATADRFDGIAADEGADGFSPLEVAIPFVIRDLAGVARDALRPMLDSVARVLTALDCDLIVLSGHGALLPVVREAFLEGLPLRPDRVLALYQQRLTVNQLDGTSDAGVIKVLPALGALIHGRGSFSRGGPGLVLRSHERLASTGFIGRMNGDGYIRADEVLFELPANASASQSGGRTVRFLSTNLPDHIGIRVPSLASWPARVCWVIEREATARGRPPKLPVKVTFELIEADRGHPMTLKLLSAVDGDGGKLDEDDVVVRLKTRGFSDGYWLDTGLFDLANLDIANGGPASAIPSKPGQARTSL